jgi:hypothetical protein
MAPRHLIIRSTAMQLTLIRNAEQLHPRRHTRHESGSQESPDGIFFAPRCSFCRTTDQRSKARLQTIPNRLRLLETAFHFLPTTTRCRVTIGRSELLACFFAALLNFVPNPFDWLLLRRKLG